MNNDILDKIEKLANLKDKGILSQEEFESIPNTVFKKEMLNESGMCIIEHFSKMDLSNVEHFSFSKKYGSTVFSFFELETEEEEE